MRQQICDFTLEPKTKDVKYIWYNSVFVSIKLNIDENMSIWILVTASVLL